MLRENAETVPDSTCFLQAGECRYKRAVNRCIATNGLFLTKFPSYFRILRLVLILVGSLSPPWGVRPTSSPLRHTGGQSGSGHTLHPEWSTDCPDSTDRQVKQFTLQNVSVIALYCCISFVSASYLFTRIILILLKVWMSTRQPDEPIPPAEALRIRFWEVPPFSRRCRSTRFPLSLSSSPSPTRTSLPFRRQPLYIPWHNFASLIW